MAALAANAMRQMSGGTGETTSKIVVNATQLYAGSYVGIVSGSGHVSTFSDTAGLEPLGFAMEKVLGDTSVSGDEDRVSVNIGGGTVKSIAVTGAGATNDTGEPVYATNDNTFTLTATSNTPAVGVIERFHSGTTCDVRFFSYEVLRTTVNGALP